MKEKELWYELFHMMRNWNRDWDKFLGKGSSPKTMDELVEEFSKRYNISRK